MIRTQIISIIVWMVVCMVVCMIVNFLMRHGPPVIYAVDLGNNTRTAGGYLIELRGKIGMNSTNDLKVFIVDDSLIWFQTHILALKYVLPKGNEPEIAVTREDENIPRNKEKTIAKQTFDYSPPIIYKAESSYGLTFPTSGKTHNDDAIYILIHGDNFGLGDKTEVYFGEKASGIIVKSMVVKHHTFINASVPEGEGLNLTIYVVVANQTGYSLDYFVNYEAPVVSEIRPYDKIVGLPPSGCKSFEDIRERDQNSIGLRCLERAMITIVGEKFWKAKTGKAIFTDVSSRKIRKNFEFVAYYYSSSFRARYWIDQYYGESTQKY